MKSFVVLAGTRRLELVRGDLVVQAVDAIVNAASETLADGHGLDRAVHAAAGMGLTEECRKIGRCPVGRSVLTHGYRLHATYVIHTVGPQWRAGKHGEDEHLQRAYRSAIEIAKTKGLESIAFHAISTGANGYPPERAAKLAFETILDALEPKSSLKLVRYVLISREILILHAEVAKTIAQRRGLWCVEDELPIIPPKED